MDLRPKLIGLLDYTERMASMGERAIFRIADYRALVLHEQDLRNRIGIHHDLAETEERVWLKIERLVRRDPPPVPDSIKGWLVIGRDPSKPPNVQPSRLATIGWQEAEALLAGGKVKAIDIQPAMRARDGIAIEDLRDVVYRLENDPETEAAVRAYITGAWTRWAEEEKPRRETIRLYESLFSLQQAIETQGVERPLEVVWGVGTVRWKHPEQIIDHPLVEQLVEIDIDADDGAIRVTPRSAEATIAIKPYQELGLRGADTLLRFARDYFKQLGSENDFSPFVRTSFEPVLRRASSLLDAEGRFYPDDLDDLDDRRIPEIGPTLVITDTWTIYARPRTANIIVEDIRRLVDKIREGDAEKLPGAARRLVTLPDNTRRPGEPDAPIYSGIGFARQLDEGDRTGSDDIAFYFPKPFNDDQVEIVRRLEREDGVVVQGPPGTGKTHTIANIICHYMATGRRVLVISDGEAALAVLRDQIPAEIRELTIALLTSERHGLKQLENAVRLLADDVSQQNPRSVARTIKEGEARIEQLNDKIARVDGELRRWAEKHLSRLGGDNGILPIELAKLVVDGRERFGWLSDRPTIAQMPQFDDADIARIRSARKVLNRDLHYINVSTPAPGDLPDAATIAAIHEDLINAAQIAAKSQSGEIPPLSLTANDALARAEALKTILDAVAQALEARLSDPWLASIASLCTIEKDHPNAVLFARILGLLDVVADGHQRYLDIPVEVPLEVFSDDDLLEETLEALRRQSNDQRPFGLVAIGKSRIKAIHARIRVDEKPIAKGTDAGYVIEYMTWRGVLDQFRRRWNQLASEINLPTLNADSEPIARWASGIRSKISIQFVVATEHLPAAKRELPLLFPFGLNPDRLASDLTEVRRARQAVELNLSRHRLEASRAKLKATRERLAVYGGGIGYEIRKFIEDAVGSAGTTALKIAEHWESLVTELKRIRALAPQFETVKLVTEKVLSSGAPIWAGCLANDFVEQSEDRLTPGDWREAWSWAQQESFLKEIDGRARISTLTQERLLAVGELERIFREVVRSRTYSMLHRNMTDLVRSALVQFAAAIRQIGTGFGIRARRFRRDAREAMDHCYSAVPCWIMPTWRVSESLPSVPGSFDLVIIDEASQSDVQALPAILRGHKVLVVGDDKQVSPVAVGVEEKKILQLRHNFLNDQPFAAMLLPGRSLYDLMGAVFPGQRIMLKEHFRCVEPIIRFSAREFYNNQIRPLRIPKASERLTPPLIDILVANGKRDGKSNGAEARTIVAEIENLVADPSFAKRSIGVVSLVGANQALKIQSMLLERLGEAIFVRHQIACGDAATFQGKERDIMFVSMVETSPYRAKTGLMYQQRFNVALSRARDRMYLVRSIEEPSHRSDDLIAKVIQHFKNPMEGAPVAVEDAISLCESEFEREVYRKLAQRGWRIRPQVKVGDYRIDFVIEGAEDRRLAIELDGDNYHGPGRWVEDYNRQVILERMGWRFWRCWGSSWTLDPTGCLADLEATLLSLGITPLGIDAKSAIYTEHRIVGRPDDHDSETEEAEGESFALATPPPAVGGKTGRSPSVVDTAKPPSAIYEPTTEIETQIATKTSTPVASLKNTSPGAESTAYLYDEDRFVEAGDRVVIEYSDQPGILKTLMLSQDQADDPKMGVIFVGRPLAQALMGQAEEEIVELPAGDGIREATIRRIDKSVNLIGAA